MAENVIDTLKRLGYIKDPYLISKAVRDREDIQAYKCRRSDVVFLSSIGHAEDASKDKIENAVDDYWKLGSENEVLEVNYPDDNRRYESYKDIVVNKKLLDVGSGIGGVLDFFNKVTKHIKSVEPMPVRESIKKRGFEVYKDILDVTDRDFQVVTLFHVFEHLPYPLELLGAVYDRMAPGGRVIIEVPHARDVLLSLYECEPFKKFTLWSDHLVLHTRDTLRALVSEIPFENIQIEGIQRYPLSNHLYWLSKGKKGGHIRWSFINSLDLKESYESVLNKMDMTDTLVLHAFKGC